MQQRFGIVGEIGVDDEGESRQVETGIRLGPVVEIVKGLTAGERVATSALGRLVDGAPVETRLESERVAESRP